MKTLLLSLLMFLSVTPMSAQKDTTAVAHILFEGVEVKGDIYDFSDALQKRGFVLKKRIGNEQQFIFQGSVCGHSSYVQVSYTKHSRTVYRVMVQPKHISQNDYLDSLQVRYGEVFDETERGYQWMLPTGAVMFFTPDGYDPTLVVMDATGVAAFKEENERPRMK